MRSESWKSPLQEREIRFEKGRFPRIYDPPEFGFKVILAHFGEPKVPDFILLTGDENAKSAYCGLLCGSPGKHFGCFRPDYRSGHPGLHEDQ
jgi:hypothetical protein